MKYQPVDPAKIEAAKKERQKEVKMWEILQEMAAYAFFLWVLLTISYGTRDPNSYLIRESLENHFLQPNDYMLKFSAVSSGIYTSVNAVNQWGCLSVCRALSAQRRGQSDFHLLLAIVGNVSLTNLLWSNMNISKHRHLLTQLVRRWLPQF